ncbi:MAG: 2-oxo acid dehydrogenase subunit E2 [Epsilonproteobacteria bacterium]|nr:2-oxo acid dehydrogenase subunit E2 [Campylobacterota bacterium]
MKYEITMPVLSDTMDKGKLIKWHVKEGDSVKKGDVIAEVESDKAIMEVQTFKDGVVEKLLAKEGDEIEVKKPIAIIETDIPLASSTPPKTLSPQQKEKEEKKETKISPPPAPSLQPKPLNVIKPKGTASPAAKKEAQKAGIDIEKLQKEGTLPKLAHLKDIKEEVLKRYFTPKALKLLKEYRIDAKSFDLNRKYSEEDIKDFIQKNNIPQILPLSSNQKAVIKTVNESLKKPSFHIYQTLSIGFEKKEFKLTAYILKIVANVMQNHPKTRASLKEDTLQIYPNSNISVAVDREDGLYMAVLKNAQKKSLQEINDWLKDIKTKKLTKEDLEGSTFGVSNLGMFQIEAFDALINQNDSAIMALGEMRDNKIKAVFTFDHRIVNGTQAAKFVKELKEAFMEGKYV